MIPRRLLPLLLAIAWLDAPGVARAGMPSVTLSDLARMRVQSISFFLLVFLLCAVVVRWAWNALRADFPRLPRLSYGKAVGVMALWGLLFLLVLTMISGARELMTPGAWAKADGQLTFRLADGAGDRSPAAIAHDGESARRDALEQLRLLLWSYAGTHDGRFPPDQDAVAIPASAWRVPDPSRMRYLYRGGQQPAGDGTGSPLAVEPDIFDGPRLVLLTDGSILRMGSDEIARALDPVGGPL